MEQEHAVVYVAQSSHQAHLLKDLLVDGGIQAEVTNEALDGGSGALGTSWDTAPRVVVPRKDADLARRVALYFDRHVEQISAALEEGEEDFWAQIDAAELPDDWPTCPECGSRRAAVCPICHTAGTEFPLADHELVAAPPVGEAGAEPVQGCASCAGSAGSCTADADQQAPDAQPEPDADGAEDQPEDTPAEQLVLCTTCDEPFVPRFARRCLDCGFDFEDGIEGDFHLPEAREPGEFNLRVIVALLALLGLAVGAFLYLLSIRPSQ